MNRHEFEQWCAEEAHLPTWMKPGSIYGDERTQAVWVLVSRLSFERREAVIALREYRLIGER